MYIRTKDGIFKLKKEEILCGVKFYDYETKEDFVNRIREENIIKQADTIEELCDEFVIVNGKIHQTTKALNKIKEYFNPYDTFYGAVWCEWGLKYVAKLDDKGEFQLL